MNIPIKVRGGKTRNRVIAYLTKNPGATSVELAAVLGETLSNTSLCLNKLHKTGATTRWRVGRTFAYMLRPATDVPAPQPGPVPAATPIQTLRVDPALEQRIAELEAWKAKALALHPDLNPVDYEACRPALEAFFIAAGYSRSASDIRNGCPLDQFSREYIDGLIAAAKLLPEGC